MKVFVQRVSPVFAHLPESRETVILPHVTLEVDPGDVVIFDHVDGNLIPVDVLEGKAESFLKEYQEVPPIEVKEASKKKAPAKKKPAAKKKAAKKRGK